MGRKRGPHDPSFKARVALDALRERETISQLSSQYKGVRPPMPFLTTLIGWRDCDVESRIDRRRYGASRG